MMFKKWDELTPQEQQRITSAAEAIKNQIDEREARPLEDIEDEESTPARRHYDPIFNDVFDLLFTPSEGIAELSSMDRLQDAARLLFRSDSQADADLIENAFARFNEAAADVDDRDIAVRHGLTMLLVASLGSRIDMIYALGKQQQLKMKGLKSKSRAIKLLMTRAQEIAREKWAADAQQSIRISAMADMVYRQLAKEFGQEDLPELTETVKGWIKASAPDYARRGGRAKKPPRA